MVCLRTTRFAAYPLSNTIMVRKYLFGKLRHSLRYTYIKTFQINDASLNSSFLIFSRALRSMPSDIIVGTTRLLCPPAPTQASNHQEAYTNSMKLVC